MVVVEERWMRRFAGRDVRLRARLHEIGTWFSDRQEMEGEARAVLDSLTEDEETDLFGREEHKHMLEVLLWAMAQADSPDPVTARRWAAFISFSTTSLAPAMSASALRAEELVLALPALGSALDPIRIQEEGAGPRLPRASRTLSGAVEPRRSLRLNPVMRRSANRGLRRD